MLDNMVNVVRPQGRPQILADEYTRQLLVEAVAVESQSGGYAKVSIDAVAQRSGLLTQTVYRLVPTKAHLFKMVSAERINQLELDD